MSRADSGFCFSPTLAPVRYARQVGSAAVAGDPQMQTSPAAMVDVWPLVVKVLVRGKKGRGGERCSIPTEDPALFPPHFPQPSLSLLS